MREQITKEEFQAWQAHPVTEAVFRLLERTLEMQGHKMLCGETLSTASAEATQTRTALRVGWAIGINALLTELDHVVLAEGFFTPQGLSD